MNWYTSCVISLAKLSTIFIRLLNLGSGATWPGEIALRLHPHILKTFTSQKITIILVAGTNGKTTTSKMIDTIISHNGKKVHRNDTGANLDNGIVSTFISDASWLGKLHSRYFIFGVDEATLPVLLRHFHPQILVLLNLFRDQLDRYGEVDTIAAKWADILQELPKGTKVVINGDDPQLAYLGYELEKAWNELPGNREIERMRHPQSSTHDDIQYFGLNDESLFLPHIEHATDSIYCPKCGNRLTFGGVYFSHLGKWACGQCGFMHPEVAVSTQAFTSPLEGVYNRYNTLAAALVGRRLGFSDELIQQALSTFTPAFGRMEEIVYHRRNIKVLLSKNPTGWNESLRTVFHSNKKGPLLLVLNDRIPDGRDVSWIWDTDIEMLQGYTHPIVLSGDRCYDLGLRLKYAGLSESEFIIFENLEEAVEKTVSVSSAEETIWVLPTYSAMLETRKILIGRKIL